MLARAFPQAAVDQELAADPCKMVGGVGGGGGRVEYGEGREK